MTFPGQRNYEDQVKVPKVGSCKVDYLSVKANRSSLVQESLKQNITLVWKTEKRSFRLGKHTRSCGLAVMKSFCLLYADIPLPKPV